MSLVPNMEVPVIFEPVREGVIMPEYNDPNGDAMDVFANFEDPNQSIFVVPGQTVRIPIGIKVGIPPGWMIDIRPRSSVCANTYLRIANSPGTIDTNYKDEICVLITNAFYCGAVHCGVRRDIKGNQLGFSLYGDSYQIWHGDKIAQMLIIPRFRIVPVIGKATDVGTDRGGGFGSSGTRSKHECN